MITLDASVLIAHLQPNDRHHSEATEYLRSQVAEQFLVHSLTMAEVLVGGVRVGRASELVADLDAIGVRVAERAPSEALDLAVLRVGTGLKLPDCCALHTALANGTKLATFDARLTTVARNYQLTVGPID